MSTLIACPGCNHQLTLPENFVGQRVQCPKCSLEFAAHPSPTPEMEVDPPAAPTVLKAAERRPPEQTAFSPAGSARLKSGSASFYCVMCGTKLSKADDACPCCGCPIQELLGDKPFVRRRRARILQPLQGFLPVVAAILIPFGLMFFVGAPIADEIIRRGPARFWIPFLFVVLGCVVELAAVVCCATWLYQAWRIVLRGDEEVSPGLMVGLLFVPFFNLYWMFRVVPGLSAAIHRELRYLIPTRAFGAGWVPGLIACVLVLIPYLQPIAVCVFIAWMLIANHALHRLVRYHEELGIDDHRELADGDDGMDG